MTEEIKDPEGLLKAYRQAVEDLKSLRDENTSLKESNSDLTKRLEEKPKEESEWKNKAIALEAKSALNATGVKDAERFFKYIDLSKVDYDEEGNISGLDDAIETIKSDFNDYFDPKKRVAGLADLHARGDTTVEKSASVIAAERLGLV